MTSIPDKIATLKIIEPPVFNRETGKIDPGNLELIEIPVPELKAGEVLVEVAGCGVCRTDVGNLDNTDPSGPQTVVPLAFEISGIVVAGDGAWLGKEVLIPAVLPCGQCSFCRTGHYHCCLAPKRPLSHTQNPGCFSSHIPVSSSNLFEINHRKVIPPLEHLAGIIDALATPFQAIQCASISVGDPVIVIGVKGMGQYIIQMAKDHGAGAVVAVNIIESQSREITDHGADFFITTVNKGAEAVAADMKILIGVEKLPATGWKIFEATGSELGQEIARNLLGYADKLIMPGCSSARVKDVMGKVEANDIEIISTDGCLPEHYPEILRMATSGNVQVSPFVLTRPMIRIREAFGEASNLSPDKRIVLTADDFGLDLTPEPKSCR